MGKSMRNIEQMQKNNDTSSSQPFIDVGYASRGLMIPATFPCFLVSKSKVGKRTVKVFKHVY